MIRRHNRRWGTALVLSGLMVATAACGSSSNSSSASKAGSTKTKSNSPYVLHAILSETGAAASLGNDEKATFNAIEKYINSSGGIDGHQLVISTQNNQSSPTVAVSLASPLISKGVPVILAGSISASIIPVTELATSTGPIVWSLSPVISGSGKKFVFTDGNSLTQEQVAAMVYALHKGWKRIAVLTTTDTSGQTAWKDLQKALTEPGLSGIKITTHQVFDPSAASVASQLALIKGTNPQAVLEWSSGTPTYTFFSDYAQAGMTGIPVIGDDADANPALLAKAAVLPSHLYFADERFTLGASHLTGAAKSATQTFLNVMQQNHIVPDLNDALAWDPTMILVSALRHLGVNATAEQLRNYIQTMHGFQGAQAVYNFSSTNHRGAAQSSQDMIEWDPSTKSFNAIQVHYPASLLASNP